MPDEGDVVGWGATPAGTPTYRAAIPSAVRRASAISESTGFTPVAGLPATGLMI